MQRGQRDGAAQPRAQDFDQLRQQGQPPWQFEWEGYDDLDPYQPDWLPGYDRRPGILVETTDFQPVDYFQQFFPREAFQLIADQTNLFALQFFDNPAPLSPHSRFNKWEDTSPQEIKANVALQIGMGLCQKNEIEDYLNPIG